MTYILLIEHNISLATNKHETRFVNAPAKARTYFVVQITIVFCSCMLLFVKLFNTLMVYCAFHLGTSLWFVSCLFCVK